MFEVCVKYEADPDHEAIAQHVLEKISEEYKIPKIARFCGVYKDQESTDYWLCYPLINISGEVIKNALYEYEYTSVVFNGRFPPLSVEFINIVNLHSKSDVISKDFENIDYTSFVELGTNKVKEYEISIKKVRSDDSDDEELNVESNFYNRYLTDIERYLVGIIRHLDPEKINEELSGRLLYMMMDNDCGEECLKFIGEEKSKIITNAKPIKGNMIDLDSCIENALKYVRGNYASDIKYYRMMIRMVRNNIIPKGDRITYGNASAAFVAIYKSKLVYIPNQKTWYYFDKGTHGWDKKSEFEIQRIMSVNFCNILKNIILSLNMAGKNEKDEVLKDSLQLIFELITSDPGKTSNIVDNARIALCDTTFHELIDRKPLIRFSDGIFDLTAPKESQFRDGKPSDYAVKKSECNFNYSFNTSQETIESLEVKVITMMEQIFPEPAIFKFAMLYLSSLFAPGNRDKILAIFLGSGDNGKTLLCNMLGYMLGEYHDTPPVSQIMGKRAPSSNATSDWMDMDRVRVAIYTEPDENSKFNTGVAKVLTGSERRMKARALYQDPRPIYVDAKAIICANMTFTVGMVESGIQNRLVVVPFLAKFSDNVEAERSVTHRNKDYIFQKDITLMDKYVDLCTSFARILLLKYYPRYKSKGLRKPSIIIENTHKFASKGDPIYRFMCECIERSGDPNSGINFMDLYAHFNSWYKTNYPGGKIMGSMHFRDQLEYKNHVIDENEIVLGIVHIANDCGEVSDDEYENRRKEKRKEKKEKK